MPEPMTSSPARAAEPRRAALLGLGLASLLPLAVAPPALAAEDRNAEHERRRQHATAHHAGAIADLEHADRDLTEGRHFAAEVWLERAEVAVLNTRVAVAGLAGDTRALVSSLGKVLEEVITARNATREDKIADARQQVAAGLRDLRALPIRV